MKSYRRIEKLLNPKRVAIVGVSKNPNKVGSIIYRTLTSNGFLGEVFPVNPKYKEIEGRKCYKNLRELKNKKIDLAIIAIPAKNAVKVVEEGSSLGIKNFVVIAGGFEESGNKNLATKLKKLIKKERLNVIGPNCIGVINNKNRLDCVFFPPHKLHRPHFGKVSIISQSGGIGVVLLSKAFEEGIGINKFISYGNAYGFNESDFIEYLNRDKESEVIILYIEGVKEGERFIEALRNSKKPIIALKAGKFGKAKEAAKTHTGAIAGNYLAYKAVFKKTGVIEVEGVEEMFYLIKAFSNREWEMRGKGIGIITNGGGLGVLCSDEVEKAEMEVAKLEKSSLSKLSKFLPDYATPTNPLDIIADAEKERYVKAIEVFMNDGNVNAIILNILFQSPYIGDDLISPLVYYSKKKKPLFVVVPGGGNASQFRELLTSSGVACFQTPKEAVKALSSFYYFHSKKQTQKLK